MSQRTKPSYMKTKNKIRLGLRKRRMVFSVINVVGMLTESVNPRRYWSDLKRKLKDEDGAVQLYEKIAQLKIEAPDRKMQETDRIFVEYDQ